VGVWWKAAVDYRNGGDVGRSIRRGSIGVAIVCLAVAGLSMVAGATAQAAGRSDGLHPSAAVRDLPPLVPGYTVMQPSPMTNSGPCNGFTVNSPVVGGVGLANGSGGWQVSADGGVFSCGTAGYFGSVPGLGLGLARPVVGMAVTPDGLGYWLVAADGGVFAFGDAGYLGGAAPLHLTMPIVGMVADGVGGGYWLVAADGGVFAFGNAVFAGSEGGHPLNAPVVGIASDHGQGYWLVAADGGVFSFGGAAFLGSPASLHLAEPASGISGAPDGRGYWIVAEDGGVFAYGSARFDPQVGPEFGTPVGVAPINPVIALLPGSGDTHYSLLGAAPAVVSGVAGRTGYDLARREFDIVVTTATFSAMVRTVSADYLQAAQYLLIDGGANGASVSAVTACVGELDQLLQDLSAAIAGRGASQSTAVALAAQISAFFGLPVNPFQGY